MNRARNATFIALLIAIALSALTALPAAFGQERNFAGSIQGAYLYVPERDGMIGRERTLDGFTAELSAKLAVDFGKHIATNVKMCFGCHGFEVGMAYVDMTLSDELRVRVGRFSPSFGEFALRHDPANHRLVDKPLPYDMGRMLRGNEWNWGILPAPYVDNGIEVGGSHWFGTTLQVDYAAYAVGGLRGTNDGADLDFIASRNSGQYYIDNNSQPAVGGRLSGTLDLSEQDVSLTAGLSGMAGYYDPKSELSYQVVGADFYARYKRYELRGEYLLRRTEMSLGDAPELRFKYGPGDDGKYARHFLKDGFYLEVVIPTLSRLDLIGRVDGLRRVGNVTSNSVLRKQSAVLRYTLGGTVDLSHGVRLKLAAEYYDFSDFFDEIAGTLALVAVL
jgi:hypothetical protein